MDAADFTELEQLLADEEAALALCYRLLSLSRARIRELEAGLEFSCQVAADQAVVIAGLETDLSAARSEAAACGAEVARLRAGVEAIGVSAAELLGTTPGEPAHLIVTFDPPTNRV